MLNLPSTRPTPRLASLPALIGLLAMALLLPRPAGAQAQAQDAARIIERGGDPNYRHHEAPEWKETEVPPPPAFDLKRVLPIEMPPYMSLRFGVDPETLAVSGDGVVRYVVVATNSSGTVNAFYEGIRCATDEAKTYARHSGGVWHPVAAPEWKRFADMNSRYVKELAKQGLCRGHAPRVSVRDMVRELKSPEILMR